MLKKLTGKVLSYNVIKMPIIEYLSITLKSARVSLYCFKQQHIAVSWFYSNIKSVLQEKSHASKIYAIYWIEFLAASLLHNNLPHYL